MKRFLIISLSIFAIIFSSQSFSIAAQPPDKFMNYNLRSIYSGMGDGGTQLLSVTVREFVEIGLNKGSWEKVNDAQWNYRIKSKDGVTKKVTHAVYVFSRYKGDPQLEQYFKNDVILTRLVINNEDIDSRRIFALAFRISNNVYPTTERGKQQVILEAKKREEDQKRNQMEIEQQRKEAELAAANKQKELEQKEKLRREELAVLHKQKLIDIQGHYENREGRNYAKKNGEIDVKVEAQDKIIFSVVTAGSRSCRIDNKSTELSHSDDYSVSEAEFNDGNCKLTLKFRNAKMGSEKKEMDVVEINQSGKCSYCEKGAYISGRYLKTDNTVKEKSDVGNLFEKGASIGKILFK